MASMYSLLDIFSADAGGASTSVLQGSDSALCFRREQDRMAFVDQILIRHRDGDMRGDEHDGDRDFQLKRNEGNIHARIHLPAKRIGLVAQRPTLLSQLSAWENLGLIADQLEYTDGLTFPTRLRRAVQETGLLQGVDLGRRIESLPWTVQVEINFLQAWLREPEWLLFDNLFEHEESASLSHLPALFRRRYPLRAMCHLGRTEPVLSSFNIKQVIRL